MSAFLKVSQLFSSVFFGIRQAVVQQASISEKLLIGVLAIVGLRWLDRANRAFSEWKGLISSEDLQARRQHRSRTWVSDGFDEALRLLKHKPPRTIHSESNYGMLQALLDMPNPNLVWHEHARELVELWSNHLRFQSEAEGGWNNHARCWSGRDLASDNAVLLFCYTNAPTDLDRSFHLV